MNLPGGDLEYRALCALWDLRSGTVRDVHERIGASPELAYTTVGTVLDRLLAKGLLRRRREGRGFVYEPAVARSEIDGARLGAVVASMGPRPAVATLLDALEALDPALLDELERELADRSRRGP